MEKKRLTIMIIFIIIFILAIILSCFYYKDKYIVSFETGTDESILTQYIKENSKVVEPIKPKKDGYIFVEWQLNGEKYDFDKIVNSDLVLSAKWVKEEYISVNYVTNSTYNIDSIKILKGSSINNLPATYKDGYEFIGWYLNDKLYENDIINDDATLVAHYNQINMVPDYKIGDRVLIVGNYSNSAYSNEANYDIAIGWNRVILDIFEDSEYPYMIGNENGVTGFFKDTSIELI